MNTFLPTSFSVTSSAFTTLAASLDDAGFPDISNASVTGNTGYIKNTSSSINLYIGFGASAPTNYATIPPLNAIMFVPGLNVNEVWLKSASSTVTVDFVEGAISYTPPSIDGITGSIALSTNQVPKGDADGNLVASSITDDGDTVIVGALLSTSVGLTVGDTTSLGAKIFPTTNDGAPLGDATHNFSDLFLATGAVINYANGNVVLTHSSGILTVSTGDLRVTSAGTNSASVVTVGGTQTLAGKTLTTPVIGVATGTSLAVTGLITTSSPTAAFGFATGAGGAQTQSTDKSTTVVSNTNTTAITLNNASLAAATIVSFTFTNSAISATDHLLCTHQSAGTSGAYTINAFPGAGSAVVSVRNNTAGALAEAIVIRISILKAVSA